MPQVDRSGQQQRPHASSAAHLLGCLSSECCSSDDPTDQQGDGVIDEGHYGQVCVTTVSSMSSTTNAAALIEYNAQAELRKDRLIASIEKLEATLRAQRTAKPSSMHLEEPYSSETGLSATGSASNWNIGKEQSRAIQVSMGARGSNPSSLASDDLLASVSNPALMGLRSTMHDKAASLRMLAAERGVVEVRFAMTVRRVFNVDTVAQTFGVQLNVIMAWLCPDEETPPPPTEDDGDWVPEWTPKYRIKHLMEELQSEVQYAPQVEGDTVWIVAEADHLVKIYEELELHSFPTDCQELHIELESKSPINVVKWVPYQTDQGGQPRSQNSVGSSSKGSPRGGGRPPSPSSHSSHSSLDHSVVKLCTEHCHLNDFRLVHEIPFTYEFFEAVSDRRKVSGVMVIVKVSRKSSYYLLNVLLVMMLISSFALAGWSLHPADVEGRHSVDFNLILTAVAFKLILTSMLPPVSYATLLDIYVMGAFGYLTMVTILHTVLPSRYVRMDVMNSPMSLPSIETLDEEFELIKADNVAFYVSIGVWLLFNVSYALYFVCHSHSIYKQFVEDAIKAQERYDRSVADEANNAWQASV